MGLSINLGGPFLLSDILIKLEKHTLSTPFCTHNKCLSLDII